MRLLLHSVSFLACALCALSAPPAQAQVRPAKINAAYVYPAGGQAGTTFRIWVGGSGLARATGAILSDNIGTATLSGTDIPSQKGEMNAAKRDIEKKVLEKEPDLDVKNLSQRVQAFLKEHPEYAQQRKDLAASFMIRELSTSALADLVCFEVTLKPDAAPGMHNILVRRRDGLINPLPFMVDDLPEFTTPVFRDVVKADSKERVQAHMFALNLADNSKLFFPEEGDRFEVTPPVIVNGQVTFAKPDTFVFPAKKGQKIVVAVWARALIPYISDAVPGWFQAVVTVRDDKGEEIAWCDDFYHDPDPMLCFEAPRDGTYSVEIKDAVSRGREDLVYRMLIGEVPFATGVSPLGVQADTPAVLSLSGWNLPQTTFSYTPPKYAQRAFPNLRAQGILHKPLALQVWDAAPVEIPNGAVGKKPYNIALPAVLNGKIPTAGARQAFVFEGKKGQTVHAEVFARRLNSPLDSFLILRGPDGKVLAQNDDTTDLDEGLITHHADARVSCVLPANGEYRLELFDAQGRGGEAYDYNLRVGAPQPDIALRVTPSTANADVGKTIPLTIHLARKGGFDGPVTLKLKNAPKGAKLSGSVIPPGVTEMPFTLTIPADANPGLTFLSLEGGFSTEKGERARMAVPAEQMMQAFYLWHLVPYRQLRLNIVSAQNQFGAAWRANFRAKPLAAESLVLPRSGLFTVDMGRQPSFKNGRLTFELENAPNGVAVKDTRVENERTLVDLEIDPQAAVKTSPGNLIFNAVLLRVAPQKEGPPKKLPDLYMDTVPAVPFVFEAAQK